MPLAPTRFVPQLRLSAAIALSALLLAGCAANRASTPLPDYTALSGPAAQASLDELAARYRARPRDRQVIIHYAAALRAGGQAEQAIAVLEAGLAAHPEDREIRVAFAKALSEAGRFEQALTVVERAIVPQAPDWNALLVKGAVLDQMGRHEDARRLYAQGLTVAPNEPSLHANLGLSHAITNELDAAETHLRRAVALPRATSRVRQNLALVLGLQGRFADAERIYAAELPPEKVEANMAYIRALLTQQNRWALIEGA
ncbi:tetratricopeptide repeat protein [Arsenicitalea aurantiaca]|nr:tetratricopeptide repeat protein [Arsenicitalea aurantiaca]